MKKFLIVLLALAMPAFQQLYAQNVMNKEKQNRLAFVAEEEKQLEGQSKTCPTQGWARFANAGLGSKLLLLRIT